MNSKLHTNLRKAAYIPIVIALVAALTTHSFAQPVISYSFRYFSEETDYTYLVNDTSVNDTCAWAMGVSPCGEWAVPLGFHYSFFTDTGDTVFILAGQYLYSLRHGPDSITDPTQYNLFMPISVPLYDKFWFPFYHFLPGYSYSTATFHSESPVSYVVDGIAPHRIAKIQFKNAGFEADTTDSATITYQVWMYEDSNALEFRYGPRTISPAIASDSQAWVGLCNDCVFNFGEPFTRMFIAHGLAAAPSLLYYNPDTLPDLSIASLAGIQPNRIVYRFVPYIDTSGNIHDTASGIAQLQHVPRHPAYTVSPNPATDVITISHKGINDGTVSLMDATGRLVWQRPLSGFGTADVHDLAPGLYIIRITSPGTDVFTTKLIKR